MAFPVLALSLALLIPGQQDEAISTFTSEDVIHQPFSELLDLNTNLSPADVQAVRSRLERERDQKIKDTRAREEQWKYELKHYRSALDELNTRASRDTPAAALQRSNLHSQIAVLERLIQDAVVERERTLPLAYELQLNRLWLAEHWPERRAKIQQDIARGNARDRRHGDAEDIGYRVLVQHPEKDIETGRQAARQMLAGGWLPPEIEDAEIQNYVRKVAAVIAAGSDLKVPLRVTVLDSREPRVLALPGGFLYITSGVLRVARSEDELAGVLSREIARIAARHGTRTSKMSWISRMFVPVSQVATGIFTASTVNPAAYYGIGYGVEGLSGILSRVLNGTSEGFEKEADQLGVQYAWKAGYDPRGFVGFLDSLSATPDNNFLAEAPEFTERLLNIFGEIQYLPERAGRLPDTGEFDRIRSRLGD